MKSLYLAVLQPCDLKNVIASFNLYLLEPLINNFVIIIDILHLTVKGLKGEDGYDPL